MRAQIKSQFKAQECRPYNFTLQIQKESTILKSEYKVIHGKEVYNSVGMDGSEEVTNSLIYNI